MDVITVVMRAFCVHRMNWAAALWVVLCKLPYALWVVLCKLPYASIGRYKTWTPDYGLN